MRFPLAAAVGKAVCDLLATGEYQKNAAALEDQFRQGLEALIGKGVEEVRVRGLVYCNVGGRRGRLGLKDSGESLHGIEGRGGEEGGRTVSS